MWLKAGTPWFDEFNLILSQQAYFVYKRAAANGRREDEEQAALEKVLLRKEAVTTGKCHCTWIIIIIILLSSKWDGQTSRVYTSPWVFSYVSFSTIMFAILNLLNNQWSLETTRKIGKKEMCTWLGVSNISRYLYS